MTYKEAVVYLESFVNYEKLNSYDYKKSFKLDRMRKFASLIGDPHKDIKSIHVAGTKGKGSTAAITHSILKEAGFKTGLYTSPHLVSFRERIKINDEFISEEDIIKFLEPIKEAVEKLGSDKPSFFEVYTALAYLYFKERSVDFAVYEVGLGGRLDATNIIEPLVSAITPISYEHMDKLGNTLGEIASEKAAIIKKDSICISAPQNEEALSVIKNRCLELNTRLILAGRDILFEEWRHGVDGQVFNIVGLKNEYPLLATKLLGSHQIVNAATAIGIIESLGLRGIAVPQDAIRRGMSSVRWDGRLEVAGKRPYIILDGAQNRASASALASAVKKIFNFKKLILVLGVSRDKDIDGILKELIPISDSVILTKSGIVERALEPSKIRERMPPDFKDVKITSNVEEALREAKAEASEEDLILITGSLFVVGEVKWKIQ